MTATLSAPRIAPPSKLYVFSLAHGLHDLFAGVWLLVLAAQRDNLGLSYTEAGILAAAYTITSAITQPSIGAYFDHTGKPYLALWVMSSTAITVTLAGLSPNFWIMFIFATLTGLGISAFHSAGLSNAKQLGTQRGVGRATAIFLLGGNGGFAIGAYMGGVILDRYNMGTLAIPAILVVLFTPIFLTNLKPYLMGISSAPERTTRQILTGGRKLWLPVLAYTLLVLGYQGMQAGFAVYLPQFFESEGNGLEYAGVVTSVFLLFSAFGSLVGGTLSDYFSRRVLAIGSMMLVAPLGYLVLRTDDAALIVFSAALGLATNFAFPIILITGQQVLPGGQSQSGGFAFGVMFLMRGLIIPVIGAVADKISLLSTLTLVGFLPFLFSIMFFLLPSKSEK